MVKALRFAAAVTVAVACSASVVLADPYADMAKFGQAMAAVTSYHMTITGGTGQAIQMDVVLPNKYHMTMPGGVEAIMIEPDMWVDVQGKWMHLTEVGATRMRGMIASVQASVPSGDFQKNDVVTDLGMKDGYHAYDVASKVGKSHSIVYLMPNDLPAKIEAFSGDQQSTITFSEFNSPDIVVSPPPSH
jgi:hypothetical protein